MLRGSCLCGAVAFEIDGRISDVGHCHCWKCRKVSGTSFNGVLFTSARSLRWTRGEDQVHTYELDESGWGSTFCQNCGCPMPRLAAAGGKLYFVPVGALDDDPNVPVAQHIYVSQKGSWHVIGDDAPQHPEEAPDLTDR